MAAGTNLPVLKELGNALQSPSLPVSGVSAYAVRALNENDPSEPDLYNNYCTITIVDTQMSGNSAEEDGGGIWTGNLNKLSANLVTFKSNIASAGFAWDESVPSADRTLYMAQILNTIPTTPFTNAYNNYDIAFKKELSALTVTFDQNYDGAEAPVNITITLPATTIGQKNWPAVPSRNGYTFIEWNTEKNGSGSTFTQNTSISKDITVYAQWKPTVEIPKTGDNSNKFWPVVSLVSFLFLAMLLLRHKQKNRNLF